MICVSIVAQVMTSPGQTFAVSVFNSYFREAFHLSDSQLTGAYGLGTLLASLFLPLVGALMDKHGIRRTMTGVVICFGFACLVASSAQGLASLFVAFFLLRLLGQGALTLLASNTVAMWFHRRLGIAVGITSVVVVASMGQVPKLIRLMIDQFGWRGAYVGLGLIVWLVMGPVLLIFFRDRPEDIGLAPDGDTPPDAHSLKNNQNAAALQVNFTLGEALQSRAYWIILLVMAVWSMVVTGLVFNVHRLYGIHGYTATDADAALSLLFGCIAATQLLGGILADRVPLRWMVVVSLAGMFLSSVFLLQESGLWLTVSFALFGVSQGLLAPTANTLWPRYFGRAHVGKIRGSAQTAAVAGSSLGPFMMGVNFDMRGNYAISLWVFAAMFVPLIFAALWATPPKTPCENHE